MTVWIDADACPAAIKEIVIRAAERRRIPTIFVANKIIALPTSEFLSRVQVADGADVADRHIAEAAVAGDIVVSQDIPLAAILVPRGIAVIDPYGRLLSGANIGERLATRNLLHDLRGAGMVTGGPAPFGPKDRQRFADAFDREVTKALAARR